MQGRRNVFCIRGGGGVGVNEQAPETLTYRGFRGNSSPENFEILKLQMLLSAFSARHILKKNQHGSTVKTVLIFFLCLKLGGGGGGGSPCL